jgi:hypothetical protein
MGKRKLSFESWFRAQFGKPPSPRKAPHELREACEATDRAHWRAVLALREREDYETRRDAALTAWQAREG